MKTSETGEAESNFDVKGLSEQGHGDFLADASAETAAHEAGHLLGLSHDSGGNRKISEGKEQYNSQNIMTTIEKGRQPGARPSEAQVRYVVRNYCNNGCQRKGQ